MLVPVRQGSGEATVRKVSGFQSDIHSLICKGINISILFSNTYMFSFWFKFYVSEITCAESPCLNNGSCSFNSTFSCHCNKGIMWFCCFCCCCCCRCCLCCYCCCWWWCRYLFYRHIVLTGFMGNFCQYEKQPCTSFPCKNGGRCSSSRGSYKCLCHTNFLGQNCGLIHLSTKYFRFNFSHLQILTNSS